MKSDFTAGFYAPLPPARTGVADYAAVLLDELRKRGRVKVNAARADVHLYHLGNNSLHGAIYERAMARPGVVVLHDAVLQHFYLGALKESEYVDEYCFNYGEWERGLARELYRERAGSGMDVRYFARPMLKRVAERSLGVIVHNPGAAAMVREHSPEAKVFEIPHFFDGPTEPHAGERSVVRRRLGIPENAFVFAVFGHLRETKRIRTILQAFGRLRARYPGIALLLAGAFASLDLERAVGDRLGREGVFQTGYLAERAFWQTAAAVDACLNLRWPTAGETSGIGVRLMGLGKPVFFTEGREVEGIPGDACVRIDSGIEESAELFETMKVVVALPRVANGIGIRARHHVNEFHSLSRAADQYWNLLCALGAPSAR